jgi:hypothetical protein
MKYNFFLLNDMSLTLNTNGDFTPQEASEVIREALEYNERIAKYKIEKYSIICKNFEIKVALAHPAASNGVCSAPALWF